jgi:hypothetical protein
MIVTQGQMVDFRLICGCKGSILNIYLVNI